MGRLQWLLVLILISLFVASGGREIKLKSEGNSHIYNHTLAKILVEYASAVYISDLTELFTWTCSRCNDLTKGFEMIELVADVQNCLQAFVGVARDLNSIIIAFRGTQEHSIRNWIEDLFWKQLDLNYQGMPDAMVHHGFYSAYHNTSLRPVILSAVQNARELYGNIDIIVTGHSMGGALASFCALDLSVNYGMQKVQLMTFGQPRVGNAAFVSYFSNHVPHSFRVTNENDIVPHLPPYYTYFPRKTYHHFPIEVWLHDVEEGNQTYVVENICDGSGEDSACSRSVHGNSISDHLKYYGIELGSDSSGSCKIVMDDNIGQYHTDLGSSIIFSRDPTTSSFLKSKLSTDAHSNSVQYSFAYL